MSTSLSRLAVAVVYLALVPAQAGAQMFGGPRPERPSRALFGNGVGQTEQELVFNGSLGIGWDRLVFPGPDAAGVVLPPREASFGSGSAALSYGVSRPRVTFGLNGQASLRYAPELDSGTATSYGGSASTSLQLSARTSLAASVGVSYQPLSALSLFPEMFGAGAPPIPTDYDIEGGTDNYMTDSGAANLSRRLTSRSSLSVGYSYGHAPASGGRRSQFNQGASARYSHELARGLGMRLGYGRRIGQYSRSADSPDRRVQNHTIDAGVDFSRALSFSRRTSLSFSTGSAIVTDSVNTRFDIVGSASLAHEIGRSWGADLSYNRHVGFLDSIGEPTFSDSVSASLGGLVSRRISLRSGAGASFGTIGVTGVTNGYRAVHASAGVQLGVTRSLAVELGYVYYRYRFDSTANLPSTVGTQLNRQSVQLSLALWAPLYSRARSSDASR